MATVKIQATKTLYNYLNKALQNNANNYSVDRFVYHKTPPGLFTDDRDILMDADGSLFVPVIVGIYKSELYAVNIELFTSDLLKHFNYYKKTTKTPDLDGFINYIIESIQI